MAKAKEKKQKERKAVPEGVPLSDDLLRKSLQDVGRTVDGAGYAFVKLACIGKGVTIIPDSLSKFIHLRYIDVTDNKISDVAPFTQLPHILTLNASKNEIKDLSKFTDPDVLPYCYMLNLSGNKISAPVQFGQKRLTRLALDDNPLSDLKELDFSNSLTHLSLRGCPLKSMESMPSKPEVTALYLSHTPLISLKYFAAVPGLKTLDIEGVTLSNFEMLEQLLALPLLKELSISPLDEEMPVDEFRTEILVRLRRLSWVNGQRVTNEERKSAFALRKTRLEEQREAQQMKKKKEKEEEHAQKEEELTTTA